MTDRYPDGCDWRKPPGCNCRLLRQAQGCEERCDDSLYEYKEPTLWQLIKQFFTGGQT